MDLEAGRVLFLRSDLLKELSEDQQGHILEKLNSFNSKLGVERILPFPDESSFSIAKRAASKRFALIADALREFSAPATLAPDEGVIETQDGHKALYRAILYLFVSTAQTDGRNVFVTQAIFPGLCALVDEMRTAPGIAFSPHPVYFLDLASGNIPESVNRTLMLFAAMGVGYVSVYRADFDPAAVPRGLEELLGNGRKRYYSVDAERRLLTFTTSQFAPGRLLVEGATPANWVFHGSNDKFYWSEVLPVAVVAAHSGFRIDCSEVVSYLDSVLTESDGVKMSTKYHRTVALFDYIKKLSELN